MKHAVKRTKGVRWERWHRMVVLRTLQLMVMNGVIRRAEVDPPLYLDDRADSETNKDREASVASMPHGNLDNQGWLIRFFRRRTNSPFIQARHTT